MRKTRVFDSSSVRRLGLLRLVSVIGLVGVAACSGSDDDAGGADSVAEVTEAGSTADDPAAGDTDDAEADNPAGDAGDTDGAADAGSGSDGEVPVETGPIKIGFHNMEGGAMSFTQISGAATAAIADINARGGVNGRELELMICGTDGSPESSIDCANKFVEADVAAAVQGLDLGADALLPILADAGIPEVGYLPFTPSQRFAVDDAAFFGSPTPANAMAVMILLADQGVEKVTLFTTETPTVRAFYEEVIEPMAEDFGIEAQTIFYPAVGADWSLIVSTGLASGPDAVATIGAPEQDCVGMVSALDASGFEGPIFMAACSAFVPVLQDKSVGVFTYSDFWWPVARDAADEDTQEEIDRYLAAMEEAGHGAFSNDGLAIRAFAAVQNLAEGLASVEGTVNGESVMHTLRTSGSHDGFMGQSFNCDGSAWPGDTACSLGVVLWQVNDQLGLDMVSDGYLDLTAYQPAA